MPRNGLGMKSRESYSRIAPTPVAVFQLFPAQVFRLGEFQPPGMLETHQSPDVGVGQELVQVTPFDQITLFGVGALGVVTPGVVADAPETAGRRGEHHRIVYAAFVVRENVVSRHAQRIEPRYRDVAEDRDVGRRRDRVRAVEAVESRRQQADAETRILRVAGTSGEGEVDLLLEGLVGGRLPEVIDDAPQEGFLFGSLRRQRGVGVAERVAVGGADSGLLGMRREAYARAYEQQNGEAAQHPGLFVLLDGFVEGLLVGVGENSLAQEHQFPFLRYDHQHELVVAVAQPPCRA